MSYAAVSSQSFNPLVATREEFIGKFEELVSELQWVYSLLANRNLNGNQCRVLNAVKQIVTERKLHPADGGFVQVYRDDIAERAGVSVQVVSSNLTKFDEQGIIGRKHVANGFKQELHVSLPKQTLANPSGIGLFAGIDEDGEEKDGWGGKRIKQCPTCKGTDLEEKHYFVCKNAACGEVIEPDKILEPTVGMLALEAYPIGPITEMTVAGIEAPRRPCFHCKTINWYPAWIGGQWAYDCSHNGCHPNLINSQGRDLTLGELRL